MPLIHSEQGKNGTNIGIWEIHEQIEFFMGKLKLSDEDKNFLENIHARRALEWAASRYLIRKMSGIGPPFDCLYDPHGKPYIPGDKRHISISHSYGMAAVALSDRPIGIDIQRDSEKVVKLHRKFVGEQEMEHLGPNPPHALLHLIWSAKEAMFKLYAKGGVDFRRHLHVDVPDHAQRYGTISGLITKEEAPIPCEIQYRFIHGYIWVYAVLK